MRSKRLRQRADCGKRLRRAIRGNFGISIAQDDSAHELGSPRGKVVGDETTMQSPDERRPLDTEPINQPGDVVRHRRGVIPAVRAIAVPSPSQIWNQHFAIECELLCQMTHALAGLQHAVQQNDGWLLGVRRTCPMPVRETNPIDLFEAGAGLVH
jgi:hypothetical protein